MTAPADTRISNEKLEDLLEVHYPMTGVVGRDVHSALAELRERRAQAVTVNLYGPHGWINGLRGLSEDSWELESDPLENSDEYFAIPLYALTDPFAEIGKTGPTIASPPSAQSADAAKVSEIDPKGLEAARRAYLHGDSVDVVRRVIAAYLETAKEAQAVAVARDWVNCPICGEPDIQQRLVDAIYGPGHQRSETVEELVDTLVAIALTAQQQEPVGEVETRECGDDIVTKLGARAEAAERQRDFLKHGINAIVNFKSDLTRAQVREAMAVLLDGAGLKTWTTEDQSPLAALNKDETGGAG